jgi:uncharacterized pyridoxal phosphate-containing UPF0001 family protein
VLEQLGKHGNARTQVLIEVNVAGDPDKSGIAPAELPAFIERCPVAVVGLMTMPPLAAEAEDNRRHFAALRELAESTACASCRWAPARTTRSPRRKGRLSFGSVRCCTGRVGAA